MSALQDSPGAARHLHQQLPLQLAQQEEAATFQAEVESFVEDCVRTPSLPVESWLLPQH